MERNIVLEISDDVSEEMFDYYARFTKQAFKACKWVKAVYTERKTEQEEWRVYPEDTEKLFSDDTEDEE